MSAPTADAARAHGIGRSQLEVVAAALAFAASVPAAKLLLSDIAPLALSGTLYLSAGVLCTLLYRYSRTRASSATPSLQRAERFWLGGAVLGGGVLAPLCLFLGLRLVSGHVAGLLLNFEAVWTIGLGVLLSGEVLGRRGWIGAGAILAGAATLAIPAGVVEAEPTRWSGVALVILACALWGVDNNLTQRVSLHDARLIVGIKGLVGGSVSLAIAAIAGQLGGWTAGLVVAAVAIGGVSFGLSIVLFVRGLRRLGVVQTGTLFALAPGFAALLSWTILREPLQPWGVFALVTMTAGALFLAGDHHGHEHMHERVEHDHPHEHDAHHEHGHSPGDLVTVPHAHRHWHPALVHGHPHSHDTHHRHRHGEPGPARR